MSADPGAAVAAVDAAATIPLQQSLSSVEISVSTKGVVTWCIKAYAADPLDAMSKANMIHNRMVDTHGRPQ